MLRLRRFPRKTALVLAVLFVLLGIPRVGHAAASTAPASTASAQSAPAQPVLAQTLAARSPAATSGGVCSVPGIGDIAGLVGFCSAGSTPIIGALNDICEPSVPSPEPANAGIDSLVKPPVSTGPQLNTPYQQYGVAGQYWAATNLQCSDMTSLIGNSVAGMLFDVAKSIDRVTITVYQAAAGEGIIAWLRNVADKLITSLGNAIYFPYVAIIVIIGAIWLAWQGLIRKRGTRTIEGTVWMVVACAAAIWLIGRPADFTGIGKGVSDGISTTLNTAFSKLPSPGQDSCLPVQKGDPQIQPASYSYTAGNTVVDQNANELWTVLACKPWLDGELGSTTYAPPGHPPTPVNTYARSLLWSQAIAMNEKPTAALIKAKQSTYTGLAQSIQQQNPGIYPLFQGKQWTTRLEIGFAALLAAVVAGVLVLLISVTLILLKLGFLLLLIVGPFFLLIGTHPGFGRVVAVRWFEMLVGILLKEAAVALALSVLLYCYALIMGTSDAVLPWALKILMIALVTIAVFIYRKPFQHLFSAVGYGVIGSKERAELDLRRAGTTMRGNTLSAASAAVPGFAAYRAARSGRRSPAQAPNVGLGAAALGGAVAGAAGANAASDAEAADAYPAAENNGSMAESDAPEGTRVGGRAGLGTRTRVGGSPADGDGRDAPPLNLPARETPVPASPGRTRNGDGAAIGPAPARRAATGVAAGLAAGAAAGAAAHGSSSGAGRTSAGGGAQVPAPAPRAPTANPAARPAPPAAPANGDARAPAASGSSGLWASAARPSGSQPTRQSGSRPDPAGPAAPRPAPPPAARPAAAPSAAARPPAARPSGPPSAWPGGSGSGSAGSGSGSAGSGSGSAGSGSGRPAAWPGGSGPARQAAPQSPAPSRQAAPQSPAPARAAAPAVPPSRAAAPAAPPARAAAPAAPAARQSGPPAWAGRPTPARQGGPAASSPESSRLAGPAPAGRRDAQGEADASRRGDAAAPPSGGAGGGDQPESSGPFWLRPIRRRK
jgi:hypothetical protein